MPELPIAPVIRRIIHETYGPSPWAAALTKHLCEKIAAGDWDSRGREHGLMLVCWDWMTGGTTAASVARKIEAVLDA